LRLFSFGGYELALAALALVVFGAIECPQIEKRKLPVIKPPLNFPDRAGWGD